MYGNDIDIRGNRLGLADGKSALYQFDFVSGHCLFSEKGSQSSVDMASGPVFSADFRLPSVSGAVPGL